MDDKTQNTLILVLIIFVCIFAFFALIHQIAAFRGEIFKYTLIKDPRNAKKPLHISGKEIPKTKNGKAATYCVWLNMNDFSYNMDKAKHVFHVGEKDKSLVGPGVWFYPKKNKLAIKFTTTGSEDRFTDGKLGKVPKGSQCIFPYKIDWDKVGIEKPEHIKEGQLIKTCEKTKDKFAKNGYCPVKLNEEKYVTDVADFASCAKKTYDPNLNNNLLGKKKFCDIENIPMNRWFHLALEMDGPTLFVYIDGRLRKTCVVGDKESGTELVYNKGDIYVTQDGGFGGMITGLRIFPGAIGNYAIHKLYKRGPMNQNIFMPPTIKLPEIPGMPKFKIPKIKLECEAVLKKSCPDYNTAKYELAGSGSDKSCPSGSGSGSKSGGSDDKSKVLNFQEEGGYSFE